MKPVLKVLADDKEQNLGLIYWGNESGLDGTNQSYIYALMRKFSIVRSFVTVEEPSKRLLDFLTKTYAKNIATVTYNGLVDTIVTDGVGAAYTSLVVRAKDLDAFYFKKLDGYGGQVVLFFNDPKVFYPLKERKQDFFEYPLGNYELMESMMGYYLMPLSMTITEKPILDKKILESLLYDTEVFFKNRDFYQGKNPIGAQIPHKRGILLIGPPGNGKTTFIKSYLTHIHDKYGILIDCAKYLSSSTFNYLGVALGGHPKVLIFEDVDGVTRDYSSRSAFLNFLDGANELNNTLTIATTNFPQRLDDAILDRPSRFDTILYVGKPTKELRAMFLMKWFPELRGDEERLRALALGTEGFSGAYFKELFIMTGLRRCSVEEALDALKERQRMIQMAKSGDLENYTADESLDDFEVTKIESSMFTKANLTAALQVVG